MSWIKIRKKAPRIFHPPNVTVVNGETFIFGCKGYLTVFKYHYKTDTFSRVDKYKTMSFMLEQCP